MKKILYVLILLFGSFVMTYSQNSIATRIIDKNSQKPIEFAGVRLLQAKDSSLVEGMKTDSTGIVNFKNIKKGNYILQSSFVGYVTANQNLKMDSKDLMLGDFMMEEDAKMLKDLEVTGTQVQVVTKGDTIEYNAGAFKTTESAVVEDLLKKMPGVEVTADGKIMVNGQEVKKVRVDGKKFFGDDKEMATKNIPANLIDRVQVVDQKSEMAQLTGFDDGETERIINLTIRKDKKQGIFGNVTLGAGADTNPEFRYDANTFLNIMNGNTRSSITAGANNVNTARSGRGRGGFGGSRSGITETQNLGYNINSELSNKLIVGGDATFNHSDNLVTSESNRENYMQNGTYYNINSSSSNRENYQGNLRMEVEWKPDSLNSFIFQPNVGFTSSNSRSKSDFTYLQEQDTTSWGNSRNSSSGLDKDGGLTLIYNRKFSKPGRTFTARINSSMSEGESNGYNYSLKNAQDSTTILDQRNFNSSENLSYGARLSYVEPLGLSRKHFLETSLSFNGNQRNSVRNIFDLDAFGDYSSKNMDYSNEFDNSFYRETLELNYRYVNPNYNLTLGMTAEPSQTSSTTTYGNASSIELKNNVINFAPVSRLQYNFGKKTFARLDYRGRTNQPSISQMQPVKNNTDLMNETVGNMNLKPAFSHDLRLMYSNYNQETFRSFNIGINANATKDNLTNNSIYDKTGKRYVQTINSDKIPYNLNSFFMFNQPFLKKFNVSSNTSFGVNQQYGFTSKNVNVDLIDINNLLLGDLSNTIRYNASENLSLSYTHEIVDVALRGGLGYSYSKNNFNAKPTETYDWNTSLNLGLRPTQKLSFNTDLSFNKQNGYSSFNASQWLWNASMDFTTFKSKGIFSLRVVDILQQRQNISQSVGDNYIQFSKSNALPSYVILSFTYKISKFAGLSSSDKESMENSGRRGPGMMPGGFRGRPGMLMPMPMN